MADNQTAQAQYELPEGTGNNPQEDYNDNFRTADHAGGWVTAEVAIGNGGIEGEWYTFDATGKAKKAQADTIANCALVFILTEDTAEAVEGRFLKAGNWVKTGWAGDPSKIYYLSQTTPGAWTTTEPPSGIKITLGRFYQDTETFHIAEGGGSGGGGAGSDHALLSNLELATSGHTLTQSWVLPIPVGGLTPAIQLLNNTWDSDGPLTGYDIQAVKTAGSSTGTDHFIGHRSYFDYDDPGNTWGQITGVWNELRINESIDGWLTGTANFCRVFAGATLGSRIVGTYNYLFVADTGEVSNNPVEGTKQYVYFEGQGVGGSGAVVRGTFTEMRDGVNAFWYNVYGDYITQSIYGEVSGSVYGDYHSQIMYSGCNITNLYGDYFQLSAAVGTTVTNVYGAYYNALDFAGVSGDSYAVYVTGASWDWGVYIADNIDSYFAGTISAGQALAGIASEAFGAGGSALGDDATAIGNSADAAGDRSIAMGTDANTGAGGNDTVAIGYNVVGNLAESVVIGSGASCYTETVAIGYGASITDSYSIAIGHGVTAGHEDCIALGHGATTSKDHQIKIGSLGHELDWLEFVTTNGYILVENAGFGIYENSAIGSTPSVGTSFQIVASSIDTADTYKGFAVSLSKSAGATDASDFLIGSQVSASLNQTGGVMGEIIGASSSASLSSTGTTTELVGNDIVVQNFSTGLGVTGWMIGQKTFVRNLGPSAVMSGDIAGHYVEMDIDGTSSGTAYMQYFNELSNIDYCIYQNGTAPSRFGGPVTFDGGATFASLDVGNNTGAADAILDVSEAGDIITAGIDKYNIYSSIVHNGTSGDTSSGLWGAYITTQLNNGAETIQNLTGIEVQNAVYNGTLDTGLVGIYVRNYSNGVVNASSSHSYGVRTYAQQGASGVFTYQYYGFASGGTFAGSTTTCTHYYADGDIADGWDYFIRGATDAPSVLDGTISAGQETAGTDSEAFGSGASAVGDDAIALGHGATAGFLESIVIGTDSVAGATGTIIIGPNMTTSDINSILIGEGHTYTRRQGVIIGASSSGTGNRTVAIGGGINAQNDNVIAIGNGSIVSGAGGVAIGRSAVSAGASVVIGLNSTNVGFVDCVIIGTAASGTGDYGVAIGDGATASGRGIAIGANGVTSGGSAVAIGDGASGALYSVIIGRDTSIASGASSAVAIGYLSTVINNAYGVAVGRESEVNTATNGIAIGYQAVSGEDNTVVVGAESDGTGTNTVIVGYSISSTAGSSVLIGADAAISFNNSVAIGYQASVNQTGVAVGYQAVVGTSGTSIGHTANSASGVSIGYGSTGGSDSIAIGRDADATSSESIALGRAAATTQANEMVVGAATYEIDTLAFIVSGTVLTFNNSVDFIGNVSARPAGTGTSAEAFGASATATGDYSTVLGNGASASGADSVVMGYNASSGGVTGQNVIIGYNTSCSSFDSVIIGFSITNTNAQVVVVGRSANTGGNASTAIGYSASTSSFSATALGADASAGTSATALGRSATASHSEAIALGRAATTTQANEMVVGAVSYEIDNLTFIVSGTYLTFNNLLYVTDGVYLGDEKPLYFDGVTGDYKIVKETTGPLVELNHYHAGNLAFALTSDIGHLGDKVLFTYDIDASNLIQTNGVYRALARKTANYTITELDHVLFFNSTSATLVATLPAGGTSGKEYRIVNTGQTNCLALMQAIHLPRVML